VTEGVTENNEARRSISTRLMIAIGVSVALLDQATKLLILQRLEFRDEVAIIPGFFNLTLTYNKGIAFGLLSDLPDFLRQVLISVATLMALLAVLYFLVRHYVSDRIAQGALAMIIGGAVGNIIDRVRLGMVVDFFDVYYSQYHWPAFNIADSAVCIGVLILLFRPTNSDGEEETK